MRALKVGLTVAAAVSLVGCTHLFANNQNPAEPHTKQAQKTDDYLIYSAIVVAGSGKYPAVKRAVQPILGIASLSTLNQPDTAADVIVGDFNLSENERWLFDQNGFKVQLATFYEKGRFDQWLIGRQSEKQNIKVLVWRNGESGVRYTVFDDTVFGDLVKARVALPSIASKYSVLEEHLWVRQTKDLISVRCRSAGKWRFNNDKPLLPESMDLAKQQCQLEGES